MKNIIFNMIIPIMIMFGLNVGQANAHAIMMLSSKNNSSSSELNQISVELNQIKRLISNYDFSDKNKGIKNWNVISEALLFFKKHNTNINDSLIVETKTKDTQFTFITKGMTEKLKDREKTNRKFFSFMNWIFVSITSLMAIAILVIAVRSD